MVVTILLADLVPLHGTLPEAGASVAVYALVTAVVVTAAYGAVVWLTVRRGNLLILFLTFCMTLIAAALLVLAIVGMAAIG